MWLPQFSRYIGQQFFKIITGFNSGKPLWKINLTQGNKFIWLITTKICFGVPGLVAKEKKKPQTTEITGSILSIWGYLVILNYIISS